MMDYTMISSIVANLLKRYFITILKSTKSLAYMANPENEE